MNVLLSILSMIFLQLPAADVGRVALTELHAKGYPAHVDLRWHNPNGYHYEIYRYDDESQTYDRCAQTCSDRWLDFGTGHSDRDRTFRYSLVPSGISPQSEYASVAEVSTPAADDEALLSVIQYYTTMYFYEFAHPSSGMARERSNGNPDIVTVGGTGFGIMALIAGAERGFLSRSEFMDILTRIVDFLEKVERFHGAWAHWYDAGTGKVKPFSLYDDGGDIVETAFLVQGLLTARQWLMTGDAAERSLAGRCDRLWRGVDWKWYTRSEDAMYWHWSKNHGWKMGHRLKGYDETLLTYVLAASSPTHNIERSVFENCFKASETYINDSSYYGIPLLAGMPYGGPLFFAHYSFLGLDPRGLDDGQVDYWTRNRNHTMIHYMYALNNPRGHVGLGAELWGFTSSDDPLRGYSTHHPATDDENGTVSPTAAVSSIVYTPRQSLAVMRHLYYDLGSEMMGFYGFYDAYNPSMCRGQQVVRSYLAIDQGPQAVMIENYRTALLWRLFMSCPEIRKGLERLGFITDLK